MTTGFEFSRLFDLQVGMAYTGYYDAAKKNRLFKQAVFTAIQNQYRGLVPQSAYDNLSGVIKTNQPYTPVNNEIFTLPPTFLPNVQPLPAISDYEDLLTIKASFAEVFYANPLDSVSDTTPIVIELSQRNNLRTTERIEITGIIGNSNANGVFYIRKISDYKAELYSDYTLQVPVAGNGTYISGGVVSRIYDEYCKMYRSDQKIDTFTTPTVRFPKFETVENRIKLHPLNVPCRGVTIDYITKAVVFPDANDATIDLEQTYRYNFLLYILYTACVNFAEEVKDKDLYATNAAKLQ